MRYLSHLLIATNELILKIIKMSLIPLICGNVATNGNLAFLKNGALFNGADATA